MFGRGDGVAVRRVHHHDAARGGGTDIDVVDADAGAADDLQVGGGVEQLPRHLGGGADREPVIWPDDGAQVGRRQAGLEVHLDPAPAEDVDGGGGELVADENLGHRDILE